MYEFRCKNEKAGKKMMEKNNAKKLLFYFVLFFVNYKLLIHLE